MGFNLSPILSMTGSHHQLYLQQRNNFFYPLKVHMEGHCTVLKVRLKGHRWLDRQIKASIALREKHQAPPSPIRMALPQGAPGCIILLICTPETGHMCMANLKYLSRKIWFANERLASSTENFLQVLARIFLRVSCNQIFTVCSFLS